MAPETLGFGGKKGGYRLKGSVSFAKGEEKRRKEEDTIELKHSQVVE